MKWLQMLPFQFTIHWLCQFTWEMFNRLSCLAVLQVTGYSYKLPVSGWDYFSSTVVWSGWSSSGIVFLWYTSSHSSDFWCRVPAIPLQPSYDDHALCPCVCEYYYHDSGGRWIMHAMILPSKHSHRGEFGCLSQCLLLSVVSILNMNASTMNAMTTCSTT